MIHDVDTAGFAEKVVERSRTLPVVVDFWASWCGPCRQLTPVLEKAALEREGRVDLAKVDVDANQPLAQRYGIQGIPAVKAFRDAELVDEFTGAQPLMEVERFMDGLLPSAADDLVGRGDEASLRAALEEDPHHAEALKALARILLARGEDEAALELVEPLVGDFIAAGLAARARLSLSGRAPAEAFTSWDAGDSAAALERLQTALEELHSADDRDLIRQVMVAIFTELGPTHPLAREHRRRLASTLN